MANELVINLDTCIEQYRVLKCKQNDERQLTVYLFSNGEPFIINYTDENNKIITANVILKCKKPDGTTTIQDATLGVGSNHIIFYTLNNAIVDTPGRAALEIEITLNGKSITTDTFYLDIKPSVLSR